MKRVLGKSLFVVLAAAGLLFAGETKRPTDAAIPAAASVEGDLRGDTVIALINGKPITMAELQKPLVEAYGLKILLFQIQLNLALQKAEEAKIPVTETDYDKELDHTLEMGFQDAPKSDYPQLLNQLLAKQGMSRAEFDMVIKTNAVLRKIAEPAVADQMKKITDDQLREVFNARYGENAIIRHIACANPQEAQLAKNRVTLGGENFEAVARAMSHNARTAAMGGELPAFSRQTDSWNVGGWGKVPQGFKEWAFTSKPGAISDPIEAEGSYHILRLDQRIAPKVVKFEDVKDSLWADFKAMAVERGISELRNKLAALARESLQIREPSLKKQYDARMDEQREAAKQQERARADMIKNKTATEPTIRNVIEPPAGKPNDPKAPQGAPPAGTGPQAPPANAPTGERPPATKSAAPGAVDGVK